MNPTCKQCGAACCKTMLVALGGDLELILMRGGVVTPAGVLLPSRCNNLGTDNRCMIYDKRPNICRDYPVDGISCLRTREGWKNK